MFFYIIFTNPLNYYIISLKGREFYAKNIKKAVKKFNIEVIVTRGNPIIKYFPDAKVVSPQKRVKK